MAGAELRPDLKGEVAWGFGFVLCAWLEIKRQQKLLDRRRRAPEFQYQRRARVVRLIWGFVEDEVKPVVGVRSACKGGACSAGLLRCWSDSRGVSMLMNMDCKAWFLVKNKFCED